MCSIINIYYLVMTGLWGVDFIAKVTLSFEYKYISCSPLLWEKEISYFDVMTLPYSICSNHFLENHFKNIKSQDYKISKHVRPVWVPMNWIVFMSSCVVYNFCTLCGQFLYTLWTISLHSVDNCQLNSTPAPNFIKNKSTIQTIHD